MRTIVVYSSLTGNTKKVGEAIASGLPVGTEAVSVKDVPADLADYDCVFVGFGVDRGTADKATADLLPKLRMVLIMLWQQWGSMPRRRRILTRPIWRRRRSSPRRRWRRFHEVKRNGL